MTARAWLCVGVLLAPALGASADELAPPHPRAPAIDRDAARVVSAAREALDEREGSYASRRVRARVRAEERACGEIHAFVDRKLSRTAVTPVELTALHAAVDADCEVVSVRSTIDGGAVVEVAVALEVLRAAAAPEGAPW